MDFAEYLTNSTISCNNRWESEDGGHGYGGFLDQNTIINVIVLSLTL